MTSKSAAAWSRFITPALLIVLSVWAFVIGAWIAGLVGLGLAVLLVTLRLFVIFALRRAEFRALDVVPTPLTSVRVISRVRTARVIYGVVTGCGVAGGIVAGVLLPAQVSIAGWIVVAASFLVGGLLFNALRIAKKQALDRLSSAT